MSCDSVTAHQGALHLLPHTWLYVPPAPRLQVTSYREYPSVDGTVYTAGLSVDGENVGVLHNDGRGTATAFHSVGNPAFRQAEMDAFVAACRTHNGGILAEEWVLDELISSASLISTIADAHREGLRVIRALDVLGGPEFPEAFVILTGDFRQVPAYDQAQRRKLSDRLAVRPLPGVDRWWQEWIEPTPDAQPSAGAAAQGDLAPAQSVPDGGGYWRDLTARPPLVPDADPPASRLP